MGLLDPMAATRYYRRSGWAFVALGAACLALAAIARVDQLGWLFAALFAAIFGGRGVWRLRAADVAARALQLPR